MEAGGEVRRDLYRLGVSAEGLRASGPSWCTDGRSTASSKYGQRRSARRGIGKLWNEPNIGYWHGTPEEFYKLHDYAIDAVRRALPTARVGGPDTAGGRRQVHARAFSSTACAAPTSPPAKPGTPLDFLSFHAKGAPTFVDGHVRMGIANQLRDIDSAFKHHRVVSGAERQADRHRRIRPRRLRRLPGPAARLSQRHDVFQLHRRQLRARYELADRHGVNLEGALTWAFEFEDQPYFAGFRAGHQWHRSAGAECISHVQQDVAGSSVAVKSSSEFRSIGSSSTALRRAGRCGAGKRFGRQVVRTRLVLPR